MNFNKNTFINLFTYTFYTYGNSIYFSYEFAIFIHVILMCRSFKCNKYNKNINNKKIKSIKNMLEIYN